MDCIYIITNQLTVRLSQYFTFTQLFISRILPKSEFLLKVLNPNALHAQTELPPIWHLLRFRS